MADKRPGEWLFRIETSSGEASSNVKCNKWAKGQQLANMVKYNKANPCPNNLWQAFFDQA